jgi:hypothetical protein
MRFGERQSDIFTPGDFADQVRLAARPAQKADIDPARQEGGLLFMRGHFLNTYADAAISFAEGGNEFRQRPEQH